MAVPQPVTGRAAGSASAAEVVGWAAAEVEAGLARKAGSAVEDLQAHHVAEEADLAGAEGDWEVAGCVREAEAGWAM